MMYDEPDKAEREKHYLRTDAVAATYLRQLEHQRMIENAPPIQNGNVPGLIHDMHQSLSYDFITDTKTILQHHARAMDTAFRRLLSDADALYESSGKTECNPIMYAAAFKAQEQFCRTVRVINALDEKAERVRAQEIRKKRNQNKGKRIKARKKPNPRVKRSEEISM